MPHKLAQTSNAREAALASMIFQVSQAVAHSGEVASRLEEYGTLTVDLFDVTIPESHRARFVVDNVCSTGLLESSLERSSILASILQ